MVDKIIFGRSKRALNVAWKILSSYTFSRMPLNTSHMKCALCKNPATALSTPGPKNNHEGKHSQHLPLCDGEFSPSSHNQSTWAIVSQV